MTADQLIQYLSWAVYLAIFIVSAARAVRRPLPANIDIALFFTTSTSIIVLSVLSSLGLIPAGAIFAAIVLSLLDVMGYVLLRLVNDFGRVPVWLMRVAEGALVLLVVCTFALPTLPVWLVLLVLLYMVLALLYSTWAFIRGSFGSSGVTSRRMRAVAVGSIFLVLDFVTQGATIFIPPGSPVVSFLRPVADVFGLASGAAYFLGFATPGILRRAWQEPELRAFLARAASLPRLPDTHSIVKEMEFGARSAVGAPQARIGLWDAEEGVLRYDMEGSDWTTKPVMNSITGRAYLEQQALFTPNLQRDSPLWSEVTRRQGAVALLVAPITAGERRLGVLVVYSDKAPVFAEEDLALVQLLADQAAVILESRALIDEAARVQAREEVTRLKEDFLSAAAHDLKTPLTTLVAQAQLLERRATRAPDQPADLPSLQKMVREAQRLRKLVMELLDASRAEQGKLVTEREEVDLAACATETCQRYDSELHPCIVNADGPVIGYYDYTRILQLIENLMENAVKYSPEGGKVRIRVWRDGEWNHISVTDQGIGIPASDLPHLFERFHRGTNVDDRRFAGMGLGLYICKGIAEQHGGKISVNSTPGGGSTFHVELPVAGSGENSTNAA